MIISKAITYIIAQANITIHKAVTSQPCSKEDNQQGDYDHLVKKI